MIDVLLVAVFWVIAVAAGIVLLVVVFGLWGWASYHDAVLFEESLADDPDFPEFPTDHARRLPEIDLPLDKPDEGEDR